MSEPVVDARAVRRRYGPVVAVDGVDLTIERGEVFAILGPNGAGKTTLVEILAGQRRRDSGEVRVLGTDPWCAGAPWRARVGIVGQQPGGLFGLTVAETLRHFGRLYPRRCDPVALAELVGLADQRDRRVERLSGGQRRRLDLALALVGEPELLFLDEPTTGFDPEARRDAWVLVARLRESGRTILLTTHYLEEAERLADRAAVIAHGRILQTAAPADLGTRARLSTISWRHDTAADLPAIAGLRVDRDTVVVATDRPTRTLAELLAWADRRGIGELPGLTVSRPTLEEAYLSMVDGPQETVR
jgi:ABC-2 type transport system ATP-binding protein